MIHTYFTLYVFLTDNSPFHTKLIWLDFNLPFLLTFIYLISYFSSPLSAFFQLIMNLLLIHLLPLTHYFFTCLFILECTTLTYHNEPSNDIMPLHVECKNLTVYFILSLLSFILFFLYNLILHMLQNTICYCSLCFR